MRRFGLLPFLGLVLLPALATAFTIDVSPYNNIVRWDHPNLTYYLDPDGAPGITDGSDIAAVKESAQDWTNVSCSNLSITYVGPTTTKKVLPVDGPYDSINQLVWINNSAWTFGTYTLGVTVAPYGYDGVIIESDIAFNGYLQQWSTTGDFYKSDVKSVVIHELGHFFGLQHVLYGYNQYDPPTMAPYADPYLQTRTLEPDDEAGACFLYPATPYKCTSNANCPMIMGHDAQGNEQYTGQVQCKNGECSKIGNVTPGSVDIGGVCQEAADCKKPYSCVQLDSGVKTCTQTCSQQNDTCPSGFHCATVYSAGKDYCVPGSKKKAEAEACTSSYECATSFCFPNPDGSGTFCRIACTKGGVACPAGKECWTSSFSSAGGCVPSEILPEHRKKLGAECGQDQECESGVCFGPTGQTPLCRQKCTPQYGNCYPNYYCADLGDGRGACLPGEPPPKLKEDGAMCTKNEECVNHWCVPLIGTQTSFCRSSCDLKTWMCVFGTSCVSYGGDFGVCMPSLDKKQTGDACGSPTECLTAICVAGDDGDAYCTQNCVGGWCPNDMECKNAGYFGNLCLKPGTTSPPEAILEETSQEPEAVAEEEESEPAEMEEVVETEEEPGEEEEQGSPPPTSSKKGGCAAGASMNPAPWLLLLGIPALLRRRNA